MAYQLLRHTMFQNVGILEGNGVELEARWKTSTKSSLLVNYSYTKAIDKTANHDAGNYPRHTAYVRTDWLLIPNYYLDYKLNGLMIDYEF